MKSTLKKTFACLLAAMMLCVALPFTAFAADGEAPVVAQPSWEDYITKVEPVDIEPTARVKVTGKEYDFIDYTFPEEYKVYTVSGSVIDVKVDASKVGHPIGGIDFDVEIDGVTLTLNAFYNYYPEEGGIVFAIAQKVPNGEDYNYPKISAYPIEGGVEQANFLERIKAFFDDLITRISMLFMGLFSFGM